jgi:hypothetical protein
MVSPSPLQQQLEAEARAHREHHTERSLGRRLGNRSAQAGQAGFVATNLQRSD